MGRGQRKSSEKRVGKWDRRLWCKSHFEFIAARVCLFYIIAAEGTQTSTEAKQKALYVDQP